MHYKAKLSDCRLRAEAKSPKAIENPRAVYFEGKICLCEGWRVYHQSLYTLDVANGQWSTIQFYDDQEKCGVTLATASGKLYIVGGHWSMRKCIQGMCMYLMVIFHGCSQHCLHS